MLGQQLNQRIDLVLGADVHAASRLVHQEHLGLFHQPLSDNHLLLVDVRGQKMTGKTAEHLLDEVGVTCNKNTIPFDPESPFVTSGIRLGTAAVTTRGFKEADMKEVAAVIGLVLNNPEDAEKQAEAAQRVAALCAKYPMYPML